jgi:release factor glutamine methyltransferase
MENKPDSVRSVLKAFQEELYKDYDGKEIRQFLYILFDEWKGWSKARVHLNQEELLSKKEVARFYLALEELKKHKPIQYITGRTYFHGLELLVAPAVLIPRPETEELVEIIIRENTNRKHEEFSILDIGTGSGCIAVSLKKNFPHAAVSALDNSADALLLAGKNADRNGCDIRFVLYDILQKKEQSGFRELDTIVSNPPYVRESEKTEMYKNVLDYEPFDAIFVPDNDPLVYYKAISDFASAHLKPNGLLYLEINERFGPEMRSLLITKKFNNVEVIKDINGKDRFIRAEANNRVNSLITSL